MLKKIATITPTNYWIPSGIPRDGKEWIHLCWYLLCTSRGFFSCKFWNDIPPSSLIDSWRVWKSHHHFLIALEPQFNLYNLPFFFSLHFWPFLFFSSHYYYITPIFFILWWLYIIYISLSSFFDHFHIKINSVMESTSTF